MEKAGRRGLGFRVYGVGRKKLLKGSTWRPRGLSKSVISRVIIRVAPFRVLITLLITRLLSPLSLQVGFGLSGSKPPDLLFGKV